jgi:hypothetical protein
MIFEWHKKEAPFFTGITRGVGGFGFGKSAAGGGPGRDNSPVIITMWGAGGGGYIRKAGPEWGPPSASGGVGGSMIARTTVDNLGLSSGDQLYIYVGGGGAMPGPGGPNGGHPGGGGGGSGGYGGGGGGMSSIYMKGSYSSGTLLLIAGGGCGGYGVFQVSGLEGDYPGRGGTQSSGGAGGPGVSGGGPGSPGSQFTGGSAGTHGGGGGAGYYGGGGGPGDGGAANGGSGGSGSCYLNPIYFINDTSDSSITNGVVIANQFRAFPSPYNSPFNPGGNSSYPWVPYPYPGPMGPYARGAGQPASDPMTGQNRLHPLYNTSYGGRTTSGGGGYPGSVHITFNGVTTSYTSVGTHIFTVP